MSEALLTIEDLERQATEAEAAATAVALSEEERRRAQAVARIEKAREAKAEAEKARRDFVRVTREQDARATAGGKYLVRGIDLVALFPAGVSPPNDQLPGGGVLIIRSPERTRLNAANADIEHKRKPMTDILTELLLECVLDPDPKVAGEGARLRAFCEAYGGAATLAGDECYKLGGGKAQADKRGSS